jgi:hypothetical protein
MRKLIMMAVAGVYLEKNSFTCFEAERYRRNHAPLLTSS